MKVIEILIDALYLCLIILLSPIFVYKLLKYKIYRVHFWERFGGVKYRENAAEKSCIWIHAVSVGETIAAIPLVKQLAKTYPKHEIVMSVTTKTGREVALTKFPEIYSFQFPIDMSFAVSKAFVRIRPSFIILMELEVWPNFILQARKRNVPVIVANGRLSAKSFKGYFKARKFIGFMFRKLTLALAQTEKYADRFRKMGVQKVEMVGTMKYDNVNIATSVDLQEKYRKILKLDDDESLIIAGSAHPPEHLVIAKAFRILREKGYKVRLVLVPRHPEKYDRIKNELKASGFSLELRSETTESSGISDIIFFVDTMGELSGIYSVGNIAFIGGSLIPHGGQNMIEPAGFGVIPVFGKNCWNFSVPADELLKNDAAVQMKCTVEPDDDMKSARIIDASTEFYTICTTLLDNDEKFAEMRQNALAVVEKGKGAAKRSVALIKQHLESE
ncbi:MAG: 3-deoxy-D-manno-octulosonic acid transferase [Planctomycetes bacterium]|nr:3-deoxy-D-manno-octulosonic acid transferase [Planctomycetota bacterium]